jgi:hypothetical protein
VEKRLVAGIDQGPFKCPVCRQIPSAFEAFVGV